MLKRSVYALLLALVTVLVAVAPAGAVDAPKWVAAVYVDAQKSIGLRWIPVAGATGYKVLRSETAGGGYAEIAATAQPQYFDTTVETGSTYYYVLQAVAGAETSPNSEEKSVAIAGVKKKKLVAPQWSRVTPQPSTEFGKTTYRVGLTWKAIGGAIAYNIYRSETPGSGYTLVSSTSETQATDTVEPDKTYYYVLSALDETFQETPYSAEEKVEVKKAVVVKRKRAVKLAIAPRPAKLLWSKSRGDEQGRFDLWEPYDIVLNEDAGRLYLVSNNTFQVYCLNADNGEIVTIFGAKGDGEGQFKDPLGMGIDREGRVYVADRLKLSVQVFDAGGGFVREYKLPVQQTVRPLPNKPSFQDVAIDPRNDDLYVLDSGNGVVWVLNSAGSLQRIIGEDGFGENQIKGGLYIKFSADGEYVVVASVVSSRVSFFTREGEFVRTFGEKAARVGSFTMLSDIDYDAEGNVLVLDMAAAFLMGYLPDGRYLYSVGDDKYWAPYEAAVKAGDKDAFKQMKGVPLYTPKGIAVDSKNRFFVVEGLADRVQAFQLYGEVPPPQQEADE